MGPALRYVIVNIDKHQHDVTLAATIRDVDRQDSDDSSTLIIDLQERRALLSGEWRPCRILPEPPAPIPEAMSVTVQPTAEDVAAFDYAQRVHPTDRTAHSAAVVAFLAGIKYGRQGWQRKI